jgi:aldehyde:ferredoxin oxidoreductase
VLYGYQGRFLRVDLTNRTTKVEEYDPAWYRQYLGGYGMTSYFLLKELTPGIDPLGPENKLVIAAGPFTGAPFSGSARVGFGCKSPMTGAIGKAEVGGFFGTEMKLAGFDGLIIEGQADSPVYLWLKDGSAEIRDAGHLWGLPTAETEDGIRAETGERFARVACIGPAGEKMVRFACIVNDLRDIVGRTGMGAVMGSKKLKAIVARGKSKVPFADPEAIQAISRSMSTRVNERAARYHHLGTGAAMDAFDLAGNLPTHNFREGHFGRADKISAQAIRDSVRVGMEGCWACAVRCKKVVAFEEPQPYNSRYGGPEYETLAALGSNCGIDDLKAVSLAHQTCNSLGMDTISAGGTIAFAMEAFEKGLLTREDTGGIDLSFGNTSAMLQVLELMGKREGIGELLSEGSRRAARQIGGGAEDLTMQVKGLEMGMHEPRLKQGLAVGFAVANHGGDHEIGFHDTEYEKEGPLMERAHGLGVHELMPSTELSDRKVYLFTQRHTWMMALDSLLECLFVPWSYPELAQMLQACTGWEATIDEIMTQGRRAITMGRVFNLREGFTAKDDQLPKRFFSPPQQGYLKENGHAVDPEALRRGIQSYYYFQGWDAETGVPTGRTLAGLGLGWAAEQLAERDALNAGE